MNRYVMSVALALVCTVCAHAAPLRPVRGVDGSVVLAGHGPVPDSVLRAFLHLAGEFDRDVVVVGTPDEHGVDEERWLALGARSVRTFVSLPPDDAELVGVMLDAEAVWFQGPSDGVAEHPLFPKLLRVVSERGVVGAQGDGTAVRDEFDPLPRSRVLLPAEVGVESPRPIPGDGLVTWTIPPSSALVVHNRRQVAAYGESPVRASIAANNGWPARSGSIEAIDVFDPGDVPAYSLDLLAWLRAAQDRTGPLFPAESPPLPVLESGTLFLHGGSRVTDAEYRRFMETAGGPDKVFVCIPSAGSFGPGREPYSGGAEAFRRLGAARVHVLHTEDPLVADTSEEFLRPLMEADAVWMDGGRTYRLMDSYQHTRAHDLMRDVLARGGVVGGMSAGSQVPSAFMVRGNPRTNRGLVFDGYTTGFGFIGGVIVDAHFRQRDREAGLAELIEGRFPQMLGIGIDERTTLIIRGRVASVFGEHLVSFYDAGAAEGDTDLVDAAVALGSGERFDLVERRKIGE